MVNLLEGLPPKQEEGPVNLLAPPTAASDGWTSGMEGYDERLRQSNLPRQGETEEEKYKRQAYGQPANPTGGLLRPEVGHFEGMLRAILQGEAQGGGDEVEAFISMLKNEEEAPEGQSYYDQRVNRIRGKAESYRKDNPGLSMTSEIAGSIASSAAMPVFKAAKGVGLVAKGANAAANAAVQAFIYGFNAGEGDLGDRALQGAGTAAIAAPIAGGLAPAASAIGSKLGKWWRIGKEAKKQGLSRSAYNRLLRAAQADDALQGEGMKNIRAAGPDAMPADAGPSMQGLVDTGMQSPGPGQRIGARNIQGRVARTGGRLAKSLDDTMGTPQGPRAVTKGIAQSTSPARKAAYAKAYARPIDYASDAGREIESVLARVPSKTGMKAIEEANEAMLMDPTVKGGKQIMAKVGHNSGDIEFVEMPNIMQLDFLKRALGEMAEAEVDSITRQTTGKGLRLSGLTKDLKRALFNANDDYAAAVRLGGDAIERKQAVWLGRNIFKPGTTREVVEEGLDDISNDARQEAIKGARSYIDDLLSNVKQTQASLASSGTDAEKAAATEAVRAVKELSSRASRKKLTMLLGATEARKIMREVGRTAKALGLRTAVSRNSATAARLIVDQENTKALESGLANSFRGGHPAEFAREAWGRMMGRSTADKQRIMSDYNQELVEYLTTSGRYGAAKKMSDLFKVGDTLPQVEAKARKIAELLAARSSAVTAPIIQEEVMR